VTIGWKCTGVCSNRTLWRLKSLFHVTFMSQNILFSFYCQTFKTRGTSLPGWASVTPDLLLQKTKVCSQLLLVLLRWWIRLTPSDWPVKETGAPQITLSRWRPWELSAPSQPAANPTHHACPGVPHPDTRVLTLHYLITYFWSPYENQATDFVSPIAYSQAWNGAWHKVGDCRNPLCPRSPTGH
jgi:hypothetical protein